MFNLFAGRMWTVLPGVLRSTSFQVFTEKDDEWGLKFRKFKCCKQRKKPWMSRAEHIQDLAPLRVLFIKMNSLAMVGVGGSARLQFLEKPDPGSNLHTFGIVFGGTVKL